MGRRYSALYGVIAAALMLFCGTLSAQNNIGMHAKIRSFTMPQYHEESNRLQFIVYGKKADNKGALLYLEDLVIDFMQNGLTDVGKVRMIPNVEPYALDADPDAIRRFWWRKDHSQGIVFSDAAILDKNVKILRSDKPVQFRSTFLDVDGVGFDAYQKDKLLHIRSGVRMMLRPEARRQAMSGSGEKTYKSAAEYFEQDLKQEQKSNKTKE